jgi:hypothetical protein
LVVKSGDQPEDLFTEKMDCELTIIEKKCIDYAKKKVSLIAKHEETVKFFGMKMTDEVAKESKTFLKIFSDFFEQCEKALPAEEKKRGGGRATADSSRKPAGA